MMNVQFAYTNKTRGDWRSAWCGIRVPHHYTKASLGALEALVLSRAGGINLFLSKRVACLAVGYAAQEL